MVYLAVLAWGVFLGWASATYGPEDGGWRDQRARINAPLAIVAIVLTILAAVL